MKKNVWRGLSGLTASLLVCSMSAGQICTARQSFLNTRLGTVSTKLVDKGDSGVDGIYFDSQYSSLDEVVQAQIDLAERISQEGTVLFKNENNALPIDTANEPVTLWGLNSIWPTLGGMIGSSTGHPDEQEEISLVSSLFQRGFQVNEAMMGLYYSDEVQPYWRWSGFHSPAHSLMPAFTAAHEETAYYAVGEAPTSIYNDEVLASADNTVALVTISRDSSEAAEYSDIMPGSFTLENEDTGDFLPNGPLALSNYEKEMIELAKQHSTRVIVLINSDSAMEIQDLKEDKDIDGIVWVGEPGLYGFLGVADVLAGIAAPSGHIADTYAADYSNMPAMVNFGLYEYANSTTSANPVLTEANKADWYVVESEGIYTGYKYFETRYEDLVLKQGNADAADGSRDGKAWDYANEVTYPFGYGLSYTTFEQKLDSVEAKIGEVGKATVTVTNTGDVAGKEAVQLYVQAPYTEGGLEKSAIQLVGFAKTDVLEPGASQTVEIEIEPEYFASYDENAVKADGTEGAWVLEAGDYYFAIGNAHQALNNVLAAKGVDEKDLVMTAEGEEINADNAVLWTVDETDIETYSVGVQNALQDMDLNNFIEGAVEYTTRADWTKGWIEITDLMPTDEMMVGLTNSVTALSENGEKVTWGAKNDLTWLDMVIVDEEGNYAGVVDFEDPKWDQLLDEITLDEAIQYVEFMGDDHENLDSIVFPRTYLNDGPLGFTYDQVGGYYIRWTENDKNLPTYVAQDQDKANWAMNTMPTEPIVAATMNLALVEEEGQMIGEESLWANESGLMGPGVNLHRSPYNARNHEYYSEDSQMTSLMAMAFCTGTNSKGLLTEAKHLAFNHQELNRSGISTFMTEQAARENELRAFQKIMSTNTALATMTAFNRAGTVYAGAHEGLLKQILRTEWGWTGGIVSDMINGADYMNWRDLIMNGGGGCLTSSAYNDSQIGTMEASKKAIEKDAAFQNEMKQGIKYWLYSLAKTNATNGLTTSSEIQKVTPWYLSLCYGLDAVFGLLTLLFVVLYFKPAKKKEN